MHRAIGRTMSSRSITARTPRPPISFFKASTLGNADQGGISAVASYTTTALRWAELWAQQVAVDLMRSGPPVIIAFEVELDRPARLELLTFIRGDFEAESFWGFVRRCREDDVDHGRVVNGGWYDVVVGPVTAFWRQRAALPQYDQFSFHTQAAVSVLDTSVPRILRRCWQ
jgi:hypothetical protein